MGLQISTPSDGTFYLVPWDDLHYAGPVNGPGDEDDLRVTDEELSRLTELLQRYLPEETVGRQTLFSWAGTRPRTRDIRTGGPAASPTLHGPSDTGLPGYFVFTGGLMMMKSSIGREIAREIARWLGTPRAPQPYAIDIAHFDTPLTRDGVRHMVRTEQARHLDDILFRRTSLGWGAEMGTNSLRQLADWLGEELGWSEAARQDEIQRYLELVQHDFRFNPSVDGSGARP